MRIRLRRVKREYQPLVRRRIPIQLIMRERRDLHALRHHVSLYIVLVLVPSKISISDALWPFGTIGPGWLDSGQEQTVVTRVKQLEFGFG